MQRASDIQPTPVTLIDTHCHLEMKDFDSDREEVIKRAKASGLEALITIGTDLEGCKGSLALSGKYDFIYAAVGMHPHSAGDFTDEIYNRLKEWAGKFGIRNSECYGPDSGSNLPKVVAIGETGLDYHYDNSPHEAQRAVFERHLQLARETGLPPIIHSREAKSDTLGIIRDSGVNLGVLHCFSGDTEMAEEAMSMGFFISLAGPVTFKKALQLKEIARTIPDDYLLIETDAPYLSPEPFRGRRNEPAYLLNTARHIAGLRGINFEDLARITTLNAKRLFRIGVFQESSEIAYRIRDSLYLNITNRCTNACSFCVKFRTDYVKGHNLRLSHEPTEEEIKNEIGDPAVYKEIVFCGYGEPLQRLELVKNIAGWIKGKDGRVRINTNGHANMIHKRDVIHELKGLVDSISISLDAQDEPTYNRICRPIYKNAYQEVVRFIKESREVIPDVQVTVVNLEGVDVEKCREIAKVLGVQFKLRELDIVG